MIEVLSTPRNRMWTFILFVVCCLLGIAAAVVGISDNPTGILLAYLAATAFVLPFVHAWRASKQFRHLLIASGLAFVVFAVLHNVFEGITSNSGDSGLVQEVLNGTGVPYFSLPFSSAPQERWLLPLGLRSCLVGSASCRQAHRQPDHPHDAVNIYDRVRRARLGGVGAGG